MKYLHFTFLCLLFTATAILSSCDDNTGTIGMDAMPSSDLSTTDQKIFKAYSNSIKADSLIAYTPYCYLGKVTDPETGSTTTCNFLAQYYCLSDYKLPVKDSMICDANNNVICDSVTVDLFVKSYYGDSLNSIKFAVMELDSANTMEENCNYYTNLNPQPYLSKKSNAIYKEQTYAVLDYTMNDSLRSLSTYSYHANIKLPTRFGSRILNMYYTHPEYFKNAYTFIHQVFPGFYFKYISGNGTLLTIDASTLSLYFTYKAEDSTYVGILRGASTEEVLQNNSIQNSNVENLINNDECTYLKTPAGIFTEITLPVDSVFEDHEKDSINSAKLVLRRINNETLTKYSLPTASKIMILPKSEFQTFFQKGNLPDGDKEIITTFTSKYNSYTFENIGTLFQWMYNTMRQGADIKASDSKEVQTIKQQQWVSTHPDWNKAVLVPVTTESNTSGYYTKVYHEFGLTSTKLLGGSNSPIEVSVVYSKFNQ